MTHQRIMHYSTRFAALSLLASLSACSSSDGDKTPDNTPQTGTLVGNFLAELKEPSGGSAGYTAFIGIIFDGKNPDSTQLAVDLQQNGCELLVPKSLFCSPSCGATGVCTAENVCTPYAKAQDMGVVRLTGFGPSDVEMTSSAPGFNYQPSATLPNPPCSEGDAIGVTANDISIDSKCIAPFKLTSADPVPVHSGKGIPLTWTPPGVTGFTRVQIHLDIAHHGGKKGEINCDVPDSGSFEIPEPLVTKLVSLGLAGFPTIVVGRSSSAAAANESEVKLVMKSSVEKNVDSGITSCTDPADCPAGTTCQTDLTCK